jgi:hypothetical protein
MLRRTDSIIASGGGGDESPRLAEDETTVARDRSRRGAPRVHPCGSSKLVSMTSFGGRSAEGGTPRKTKHRREAPTTRALIAWMIESPVRCRRRVRSYRPVPGSRRRGAAGDTLKIRKLLIGWRFTGCRLRVQLVPLPPSRSEMAWADGIWARRYSRWTTLKDSSQAGAARVGRIDRSNFRINRLRYRRTDARNGPRLALGGRCDE